MAKRPSRPTQVAVPSSVYILLCTRGFFFLDISSCALRESLYYVARSLLNLCVDTSPDGDLQLGRKFTELFKNPDPDLLATVTLPAAAPSAPSRYHTHSLPFHIPGYTTCGITHCALSLPLTRTCRDRFGTAPWHWLLLTACD